MSRRSCKNVVFKLLNFIRFYFISNNLAIWKYFLNLIVQNLDFRVSSGSLLDNRGFSRGTMTRTLQPTSFRERCQFVSMWVKGKSCQTIAREKGVSSSTVCRWINRWTQEGNVYNRSRNFLSRKAAQIQVVDSFTKYYSELLFLHSNIILVLPITVS